MSRSKPGSSTQEFQPGEDFSETRESSFKILGLQRATAILDQCGLLKARDKREIVTLIRAEKDGKQHDLMFPGAVPEEYFLKLLNQNALLSVTEIVSYDGAGGHLDGLVWFCTEDHTFKISSGDLSGQKFIGRKSWRHDHIPTLVHRVRERRKTA